MFWPMRYVVCSSSALRDTLVLKVCQMLIGGEATENRGYAHYRVALRILKVSKSGFRVT